MEKTHKSQVLANERRYSKTLKGRYSFTTAQAKCNLTFTEYTNLLMQGCYYCSKSLYGDGQSGSGLDRIDNKKGYLRGNVLPCCKDCNRGRNVVFTVEEWKVAMNAILKYRGNKK